MSKISSNSNILLIDEVQEQQGTTDQDSKESGIWIFILGDMLIFSIIFGSYAFDRSQQHELYVQSQQLLNEAFAIANTILLLTGSLFVVLALHTARRGPSVWVNRFILLTIFSGLVFFLIKVVEYKEKIQSGYTLLTNDFFTYYYMITGLHMAHVLVGIGVLIYVMNGLKQSPRNLRALESGGVIWHMVDLLWIVLFPLIYLIK